jgi:hypothetical protein
LAEIDRESRDSRVIHAERQVGDPNRSRTELEDCLGNTEFHCQRVGDVGKDGVALPATMTHQNSDVDSTSSCSGAATLSAAVRAIGLRIDVDPHEELLHDPVGGLVGELLGGARLVEEVFGAGIPPGLPALVEGDRARLGHGSRCPHHNGVAIPTLVGLAFCDEDEEHLDTVVDFEQ